MRHRRPPRALARLGAVATLAGAFVLFVSTLLHPLDSDPGVPRAAFAEYGVDSLWEGSRDNSKVFLPTCVGRTRH
ncbi:MAG TPA: hypothetical protein VF058_00030 [Actinomycetota bacterium]